MKKQKKKKNFFAFNLKSYILQHWLLKKQYNFFIAKYWLKYMTSF